jgi:type II secretory pathway pseudopilin PulG
MRTRRDDERGDTLIEILLAIVLIGLMMGVLFASITMGATGSNNHKNLTKADGILRNYAEATKNAVRDKTTGCGKASPTTFTVATPAAPAGFNVSSNPDLSTPQACPSTTTGTGVLIVHLLVNVPNISSPKELDVGVRTP